MTDTVRLGLPLLQPAQAQKHVTVNDALTRLDGVVQLVLLSATVSMPPASPQEGTAYGVPAGAVNAWAGQDGKVAVASNGGWTFVRPQAGWRAFVADRGVDALYDGAVWQAGAITLSGHGAGMSAGLIEFDHSVVAGAASLSSVTIPSHVLVVGVTARVIAAITGALTAWSLGNPGAVGRFGSGIGLAAGSWSRGLLSQPMAFYAPTPLELRGEGGDFSSGIVRIAVHYLELALPSE